MIPDPLRVAGHEWHQAADIATLLGVQVDAVRAWGRTKKVTVHRVSGQGRGTAWYRLDQCAAVERDTRLARRGRPRVAA